MQAQKLFPKGKRFPQETPQHTGSVLKDYDFSYPDSPPTDGPNPYELDKSKALTAKYHIALLLPLSGKSEAVGQSIFDAAQMAAFEKRNVRHSNRSIRHKRKLQMVR